MIDIDLALRKLKKIDPTLEPYFPELYKHIEAYNDCLVRLGVTDVGEFANGYNYFGFNRTSDGWVFREWLPGADAVWLMGDFNGWSRDSHPLESVGDGVWEICFDDKNALKHGEFVKLLVKKDGHIYERTPAYIRRAVMDERDHRLCGQIWSPDMPFAWTDGDWYGKRKPKTPLIYEAHIGMAQEYEGIGSYREFADKILGWIKYCGYNTVQLMAIEEHPYYASFGYQVTNFFAPSHRFGTPEDLKYLINKAHGMELAVLLDVVHSHACANIGEGLNMQDGTETQYFLPGSRGWHPAWRTRCFDYGRPEVVHFLLSNLKYWQDEFHFDGFRFDGVTSMLYEHHGLGVAFTSYSQYFTPDTNLDARAYLMLANELVHSVNEKAITVSEDMSGMPGMCLPIEKAGFGFDYRLSMGVPDMWIKLIKEVRFEDWDVFNLWNELNGGRVGEGAIAYSESHDQAMVGDKTLMFRLADSEMYTGMTKSYHSPVIDTAIDMHKLIRLLTVSLAHGGYLNFMGNEFGHPEWIDFPREGNGWSYHYARRQWSLVQNGDLKYEWLAKFDRDMLSLTKKHSVISSKRAEAIWLDQSKKLLIFERAGLLYVFNVHPTRSDESVLVCPIGEIGQGYRVIFSTDDGGYGGSDRISKDYIYYNKKENGSIGFRIYLPCRTAVILKKI